MCNSLQSAFLQHQILFLHLGLNRDQSLIKLLKVSKPRKSKNLNLIRVCNNIVLKEIRDLIQCHHFRLHCCYSSFYLDTLQLTLN